MMKKTFLFLIIFLASMIVFSQSSLLNLTQTYQVINVPSPGKLENSLGNYWDKIDSIVVKGTINKADFETLYNCSRLG